MIDCLSYLLYVQAIQLVMTLEVFLYAREIPIRQPRGETTQLFDMSCNTSFFSCPSISGFQDYAHSTSSSSTLTAIR